MAFNYREGISGRLWKLQRYSEPIFVGILVLLYLFLSNYFSWNLTFGAASGGITTLPTSGGSDPYYNFEIIRYILQYHVQLIYDPSLNYPFGTINPRNPFFHWMVVLAAEIMSVHMNVYTASYYAFEELDAAMGALLIIPVYLMGKEAFGKKAGLVGALLYTLMPTNLSSGILSGGRMHTPELIFAFFAIYFLLKSVHLFEKKRIFSGFSDLKSLPRKIRDYYLENTTATIYALLGGASLGGLMLAWQGYAYIEAIVLIYFAVQYLYNVVMRRPSEYLTLILIPFILLSFLMGAYYYQDIGEGPGWYNAELMIGLLIILFGFVVNFIGKKPWVLIFPVLIGVTLAGVLGADVFAHSLFERLISGDGYFIKTRVYDTIAEAQGITLSTLGQYIAGFGIAPFFMGIAGIAVVVYRFVKEKSDKMLFILVFTVVSIYMSFAASRFNVTAAPAYALLDGALVVYLLGTVRYDELKNRKKSPFASFRSSIKGSIKWTHAAFAVVIVLILILPSGIALVSAAVPANSATVVGNEFSSALPSFLRTNNSSSLLGETGYAIENSTQPLARSFAWLANQDANLPLADKPAYVSWWDYGFQELYQGLHPTVADDFQQGIPQAGQALLAQNDSQIVGDFIAIMLSANFDNNSNNFTPAVKNILMDQLGTKEYKILLEANQNPDIFKTVVLGNPSIYGQYISGISSSNLYYAFVKGNLSQEFPVSVLNSLEAALSSATNYNIGYLQVDHNLFPQSATSPGIFYAPAYLTDTPSYVTSGGDIVPTEYYNIEALTSNGSYLLSNLPSSATPVAYDFLYNSSFYNTSIYRFTIGYPPSAVGQSDIIPGLTSSTQNDTPMPAWNMSNFELVYSLALYNPHKNYQKYPQDFSFIPIQQAYAYQKAGKGFEDLLPPTSDFLSGADPIVHYFPGAIIHGTVTNNAGIPVPGVRVTIFDQYGIPHETVVTNSKGQYNLTGLPGNDSIYFSTGAENQQYLTGSSVISAINVNITTAQAERQTTGYNLTTGLPDYYISENAKIGSSFAQGSVFNEYQNVPYPNSKTSSATPQFQSKVLTGNVILTNSTYGLRYNTSINDGNYNVSVPPISYEVSVYSNGTMKTDVEEINVTTSDVSNNILIGYDTIFANVTAGDSLINKVSLNVQPTTSGGLFVNSSITQGGSERFWVTPGNYTLQVNSTGLSSYKEKISFSGWNLNKTAVINPLLGDVLNVSVHGYSPGMLEYILPNGSFSNAINVTGQGSLISEKLPSGVYTIYVAGNGLAGVQTFALNQDRNITLGLQSAKTLSINSTISGHSSYSGQYEILGQNAFLEYSFSTPSYWNISMPVATYTVDGVGTYSGVIQSNSARLQLNTFIREHLVLDSNGSQAALVYNKKISPGYSSSSAVSNGIVEFYSSGIPVSFGTVSPSGSSVQYFPDIYSDLSAKFVSGSYFNASAQVSSGSTASVGASPISVDQQMFFTNQSGTPISGTLHLSGLNGNYNYTISNGLAVADVPVGVYSMSVSSSSYEVHLVKNSVLLSTSDTSTMHLKALTYATVSVSGASEAYLYTTTGQIISNLTKVETGSYMLYALNTSGGLNISSVTINGNTTISPVYSPSVSVNLSNTQDVSGGLYYLNSSKYSLPVDKNTINVFAGSYKVTYLASTSNSSGSFSYYGTLTSGISGQSLLNVTTTRSTYYSNLTGYAQINGVVAPAVTVMALNSQGKVEGKTITNSTGYFRISGVNTGSVTLYAMKNSTGYAYFDSATIPSFSGDLNLNLSLTPSFKVSIGVNLLGNMIDMPVNITVGKALYVVNSSTPSIVLPEDNYTFTASRSLTQVMPNGTSQSITYSNAQTIFVNANMAIPISLDKVNTYSFQSTLVSKEENVSLNSSFVYDFTLKNNGNSPLNVTLSSPTTSWAEEFTPDRLFLRPGSSSSIQVNITELRNTIAGSFEIPVSVNYGQGSSNVYLPANISAVKSYSVKIMPDIFTNSTSYVVPVKVKNTGTTSNSVNLSLNVSKSLSYGWDSQFMALNSSSTIVNLSFNSSKTLYVEFSLNNTHYLKVFSTQLFSRSSNQNSTNVISVSVTPLTTVRSPSVNGTDILPNFNSDPIFTLEIGLIIIAVSVVGGLVTVAYRGRRR